MYNAKPAVAKPAVDMSLREGLAGWSLVRRFPLCEIRMIREGMRLGIMTYHSYPLHLSLTVAGTRGFHLLWLVSVVGIPLPNEEGHWACVATVSAVCLLPGWDR